MSEQFQNIEIEAKSIPPEHSYNVHDRSNRKIVERGKLDTSYTHIHDRSLS